MDSKRIVDLTRGAILLAVAVLLGVLLWKFYRIFPEAGISVKNLRIFPIAIIGGICWVTYRGLKLILSALRNTG
jgi:uncharacterized membrane protein